METQCLVTDKTMFAYMWQAVQLFQGLFIYCLFSSLNQKNFFVNSGHG